MTGNELKQQLRTLGFEQDKSSEYHNEVFANKDYQGMHLEFFVDYHTVRIVWWHRPSSKVSKCYYVSRDVAGFSSVEELVDSFTADMRKTYGIKK